VCVCLCVCLSNRFPPFSTLRCLFLFEAYLDESSAEERPFFVNACLDAPLQIALRDVEDLVALEAAKFHYVGTWIRLEVLMVCQSTECTQERERGLFCLVLLTRN
jgi:hypothetical protein